MQVTINGEKTTVPPGATIAAILRQYPLEGRFVVEVSGAIVESSKYATHALREGDVVEIIRFVGGG